MQDLDSREGCVIYTSRRRDVQHAGRDRNHERSLDNRVCARQSPDVEVLQHRLALNANVEYALLCRLPVHLGEIQRDLIVPVNDWNLISKRLAESLRLIQLRVARSRNRSRIDLGSATYEVFVSKPRLAQAIDIGGAARINQRKLRITARRGRWYWCRCRYRCRCWSGSGRRRNDIDAVLYGGVSGPGLEAVVPVRHAARHDSRPDSYWKQPGQPDRRAHHLARLGRHPDREQERQGGG